MIAFTPEKPQRYNVRWDCPHCGNSHNWWWEDEFEAHDDGECDMICDRCMEPSKCVGDGNGFYIPVKEKTDHERLTELERRIDAIHKQSFDAINRLSMRLLKLETKLRDAPIVPQRGDVHIDDIDPTVMRVYDGRKWVEIRRDDDEDTDGDDGPGWGMYGYEHDEENF